MSSLRKTLFVNPPSWQGFDGGAGSRYQAKRDVLGAWTTKLTLEVAKLGQEGIDYSDARRHHRLKAAPGEEFSGLEILCLLDAGLKRIAPAGADPGVDLNDEFAMALELFNSEKHR